MAIYDMVIHGGRIIDGTGNPWFYGDVAVKGGRIVQMGKIDPTSGQRAISAKGRVITPGYIDMHTHSDQPLVADGNGESKVRQGVTLDIIGESQTVAPLRGPVFEEYVAEHRSEINQSPIRQSQSSTEAHSKSGPEVLEGKNLP